MQFHAGKINRLHYLCAISSLRYTSSHRGCTIKSWDQVGLLVTSFIDDYIDLKLVRAALKIWIFNFCNNWGISVLTLGMLTNKIKVHSLSLSNWSLSFVNCFTNKLLFLVKDKKMYLGFIYLTWHWLEKHLVFLILKGKNKTKTNTFTITSSRKLITSSCSLHRVK